MRVVLDTNVLIAAFAARGLCEALLLACLRRHEIILSEHILAELREHLADKIKLTPTRIRAIEALLREHGEIVEPVSVPSDLCTDEDDLPVLGTALAGAVEALVTGDRELLDIGRVGDVPILSPRAFYERL